MAHFAELDRNNRVLRVVVNNNNECLDEQGNESEELGKAFCQQLFGGNHWVQTSYNGSIRRRFAGKDYFYDQDRDAFIPNKKWDSWVFDEEACTWIAPVAYPSDIENTYRWDELSKTWVVITQP